MRKTSEHAATWLTSEVWPLWLEHGVDWKNRAFHEYLDTQTLSCDASFRRLRVATRQVYSFARAAELGMPRAQEAVALGLDFLGRYALQDNGGYSQRFDLAGKVIDPTQCLYDQAFTLLAFAITGRRRQALSLIEFIESHFRHPENGYIESLGRRLQRRHDSHMHLLESCLMAAKRFGDSIYSDVAERIVRLFVTRFFQQPDGALPEIFDQRLRPTRTGGRYAVEPGHHCEWAWLIALYSSAVEAPERLLEPLAEIGEALMRFTDRHGTSRERGTIYDAVWNDGSTHMASSRLWPQTERLKAEALRRAATERRVRHAYTALAVHIDCAPPGLWREHLASDGSWKKEPAPASSLYHLTCGILEANAAIKANGW